MVTLPCSGTLTTFLIDSLLETLRLLSFGPADGSVMLTMLARGEALSTLRLQGLPR